MSNGWKIALAIAAIVLLGIPLAGRLMRESQGAQASNVPTPAQEPNQADSAQPANKPAPPAAGMALDAKTLTNTAWTMNVKGAGQVTAELLPGGTVRATVAGLPMTIEGTWRVDGDKVSINAAGQALSAQIVGGTIMVDDQPAQRVR